MKTKIKNILVIACALYLLSCSSDDDGSSSNANPEGIWTLTTLSIETAFDFNEDGIATQNLFKETPCYDDDYVSFDADGSARLVSALTYISAEVNSPTDYSYQYQCLNGFDTQTTFTQNGSQLSLELQGRTAVGTISGNTLTVVIPDLFEIEMYNGTDYFDVAEDVTLVYIKS
ncbi:lipocalin family protein [Winogradskyella forsetii]|uniref:lipocalin family protein n=1 Tax=Winogradskyella forsetii TaxID=2686077 RepID=UPI0015B93578|nr:lipocalin family protein [Winogradskyella forsetii]